MGLSQSCFLPGVGDGREVKQRRGLADVLGVRKYASGTKLIPAVEGDNRAYGLFEQACSVEQSYFAAASETIGTELVIKKYVGLFLTFASLLFSWHSSLTGTLVRMKGLGPPDEARVAQAGADLDEVLAHYDTVLAKQRYLAGDELTLVDLFHLPNGSALKAFGYKGAFEKYPNVDGWFSRLQERATWVKAAALAGTAA